MSKRLVVAVLLAALLVAMVGGGAAAAPAPAAANGDVLFQRFDEGGNALYRIRPDGSDRREVSRLPREPQLRPVGVSPEGRRLAWWRSVDREEVLTVTNADGSRPADVAAFDDLRDNRPMAAWSPDGRELAIVHDNRLYTVPADGRTAPERRPQNLPTGRIAQVEWTPAGDRLLLGVATSPPAGGEYDYVLWSVNRDGGDHERVTSLRRDDESLYISETRISPDGQLLAYIGSDGTGTIDCSPDEIGVIDLATGGRRVVAADDALDMCTTSELEWSPGGDALVFEGYLYDAGMWIYRVDVGDGTVARLTGPREGVSDSLVGWSPVPDLLGRACPEGSTPSAGFADATGTAHARGIDCAVAWEIAAGRTDGTYGPGAPVTRAQMASFVARALEAAGVELPAVDGSRFDDVDPDSVHGQRIEQLAEIGLVDGVAPGRYAPGQAVTRAQMARFLVGAYEHAAGQRLPTLPDAFVDDDGIALESSVNAASSVGLATGVEDGRYGPGASVNRGQMATFLSRLVDRLARDLDLPAR